MPQLLNLGAMARWLGVKPAWLRGQADAGNIPALEAGDTYLFAPDLVEQVLRERAEKQGRESTSGDGVSTDQGTA